MSARAVFRRSSILPVPNIPTLPGCRAVTCLAGGAYVTLRDHLIPNCLFCCERIMVNDGFSPPMTVFLKSSSIDSTGPAGDGVATGSHHVLGLVAATGFRTTQFLYRDFLNPLWIYGSNGVSLSRVVVRQRMGLTRHHSRKDA